MHVESKPTLFVTPTLCKELFDQGFTVYDLAILIEKRASFLGNLIKVGSNPEDIVKNINSIYEMISDEENTTTIKVKNQHSKILNK